MKIMFNYLDQLFGLFNSKYEREARKASHFVKHHILIIYI
jgi:hypothetical protein